MLHGVTMWRTMTGHPPPPHTMDTTTALTDLAAVEASLYRLRCHLNSMEAAGARMTRQIETCRRTAGDAKALLQEATDA